MLETTPAADRATLETITAVHHWTDSLYSFKTTRPQEFRFTPGQYARLGLADDKGIMLWRAYSIVSSAEDDCLEFYVIDVPGGAFTGLLKQCSAGDSIWIDRQSFGFMTVDRFADGDELWMLATGTGLGPFISILQEPDVWQRFHHLVLVHSVRHASELAYHDQLKTLAQSPRFANAQATLHVVQTVTRDPDSTHLHGRITTLLENGDLERHVGLPLKVETSRVMLCGNPQMIEDTRKLLHQRGMRPCRRALPGQFVTENYW